MLELRSIRGTGGGPEKTILQGAARSNPEQFAVTVCYIRDARDDAYALDQEAARLGIDYVEVVERHSLDPRIWPALRSLVLSRGIQIVHAHEYKSDALALLLAARLPVTPLATAHGWTGHSPRERRLYYPADRWLLRRFPRVIAVSEDIRQTLIRSGSRPERVTTVLNGIDVTVFRRQADGRGAAVRRSLGLPESALVIGSVGRLEPQKRFDLLIDAFRRVRESHPEAHLLIAGDGSLAADLARRVAAAGIAAAVSLAGHRTDIIDVLHALDLFVQASDYEGTPNSVLEAMAVETPVVATTAGGTGQLIEDGIHGLLVSPGSSDALAARIIEALADPAAATVRVRAARRRVEQELSFAGRMHTVEAIYASLVSQSTKWSMPSANDVAGS